MPPSTSGAQRRIYLDNAATSWPKCSAAIEAAEEFIRHCGATAGRGTYQSALLADRHLEDARSVLARLIGAPTGQAIAMCNSGTHALNAALWGVLRAGDHVITTAVEHNSVLRPLKHLENEYGISVSVVPSDSRGIADTDLAQSLIRKETKLFAVGHASNVTGAVQDLTAWSQLATSCGATFLVDASQTLGYVPIDVSACPVDLVAAAGHKGLRALAGTGLLYVSSQLQGQFRPLLFGGTGRASEQIDGHPSWPQSVEVGNLNMPGVVSMAAAARRLVDAVDAWQTDWWGNFEQLVQGLRGMPAVRLVGIEDPLIMSARVPVVSLQVDGWDVHDLAAVLDSSFGIEVRAGFHCAALVHRRIGSHQDGGTLRLSTGHGTCSEEVEYTLSAFREILS